MSDDFQPPFDDADADVILRSSDGVDFRVYKVILAKASLFFKDMFSLPPPPPHLRGGGLQDEYKDGIPVVPVAEDSAAVELLLRFCYPIEDPNLSTFEDIETTLELGRKYDVDVLIKAAKRTLFSFSDTDALKVFVLACQFKWQELAQVAARQSLHQPLWSVKPPFPPELNHISAMTFCILLDYHSRCSQVATVLTTDCAWVEEAEIVVVCSSCCTPSRTFRYKSGGRLPAACWYTDYMDRASVALSSRPCGGTVTEPALLEPSLQKASQCNLCGPYALVSLHKLSQRFAMEIEEAVSKVCLFPWWNEFIIEWRQLTYVFCKVDLGLEL